MRIGEVTQGEHVIKAKDVHQGKNKTQILAVLYSSKTHGKGNPPQKIRIAKQEYDKLDYSPVDEINKFISVRPPYKEVNEQFFVFQDHSQVKPQHVRTLLREILGKLNLDSANYDTHSFRIGRATDQFRWGVDLERIKRHGRWESNAVYSYLRN